MKNRCLITEKTLQELYIDKKMSAKVIGKEFGVDGGLIIRRLVLFEIPRRSMSEAVKLREMPPHSRRIKKIDGYIDLFNPITKKYEKEHRVVWARAHGPIPQGFVIHHKNGIKDDNRIENLEMMSAVEHNRMETCRHWKNGVYENRGWFRCGIRKGLTMEGL